MRDLAGWRDSDNDGIQDIVDTVPRVYINPPDIADRLNCSGVATVTLYPNKNPYTRNPLGKRDVTINRIQSVEFKVGSGNWTDAAITPTKVRKLVKSPSTYIDEETYAIVNFTFTTPPLEAGNYTIEIKATDNWGNSGYTNTTITITAFLPTDLNKDRAVNILDVTIVAAAYDRSINR